MFNHHMSGLFFADMHAHERAKVACSDGDRDMTRKLSNEQRERMKIAAGMLREADDLLQQAADVLDGTVGVVVPRAPRHKRR